MGLGTFLTELLFGKNPATPVCNAIQRAKAPMTESMAAYWVEAGHIANFEYEFANLDRIPDLYEMPKY